MDKREFFKYSGYENSFLYEELLNSTEKLYINFVPRQTGTTTSLAHYCFYKMYTNNKFNIAYILPSSIYCLSTNAYIRTLLGKFVNEFNKTNSNKLDYTYTRDKITFTVDGVYIGQIKFYAGIKYHTLIGNGYDEIILEDPFVVKNENDISDIIDWSIGNNKKVIVINNSYNLDLEDKSTNYIENTYNNIHYTPFFRFWHINIFEYQNDMLNRLGTDRFQRICLMKGKINYVRKQF